jgi:hypothetical protein
VCLSADVRVADSAVAACRRESVLPPTSDIGWRGRHGRKVPEAAVSRCSEPEVLFDHLVGDREQSERDVKTESLGGLEVDREVELGWSLNQEVSRLLALEPQLDP